ncbi:hypothetical protein XA68_11388 [Ophiocordyceps unilateralis]|uniref:Chromo domain-containing protein n=1 Tax=Ophiocordyceps unilateralis TaxID=268505 RepID=A0A2A9PH43_OPHUN|nr:hypothetical protein XA68_11388 [Ophiocordyceps unilateralis]
MGGLDDDGTNTCSSEVSNESDNSFELVQILAERKIEGLPKFLVEWKDYKLAEATWEPIENLGKDTIAQWEKFKKRTGRRTRPGFRVGTWKQEIRDEDQEKQLHHERMNSRRLLAGKPPKLYRNVPAENLEIIEPYLEDFEDSDEESLFVASSNQTELEQSHEQNTPLIKEDDEMGEVTGEVTVADAMSLDSDLVPPRGGDSSGGHTERSLIDDGSRPKAGSNLTDMGTLSASEKTSPTTQGAPSNQLSASDPASNSAPSKSLSTLLTATASSSTALKRTSHDSSEVNAGSNVFVGGKQRKEKRTLLDAVSDPGKAPKLLRLRHQNIVQKNLRNREGVVAPGLPPSQLIPLGGGTQGFSVVPTNGFPVGTENSGTESVNYPDTAEASVGVEPPKLPLVVERDAKRKRKVHWNDNHRIHVVPRLSEEPSQTDQNVTDSDLVDQRGKASKLHTMEAREGAQLRNCPVDPESPSLTMLCQLGTGEGQSISMTFDGLPGDATTLWLKHLKSQNRIVFTHMCAAEDWSTQSRLVDKELCQGSASASVDAAGERSVADWLDVGCSCLMHYTPGYSILLFPSLVIPQSSDEGAPAAPRDQEPCKLKYSIVRPSVDFDPTMLAPLSMPTSPEGLKTSATSGLPVFDFVFGLRPDQLLPLESRESSRTCVFLAFPPSARQEACFVSQWFHHWQADCDVKSSLRPGNWLSFLKLDHGTVIIHEDAVWTVRLFPHLAQLLHRPNGDFNFYLFRKALPKMQPPLSPNFAHLGSDGDELCPVFPWGDAFLLTPSFFVSQPEQACSLMEWLWKRNKTQPSTSFQQKLVVCAKIDHWTHELALEKKKKFQNMTATDKMLIGLTEQAVESAYNTWILAKLFLGLTADSHCPVVLAPEAIAGDDEQSLVNWFGWWAIKNMHQVRKFHVVGSDRYHRPTRLSRLASAADYESTYSQNSDDKSQVQDQESRARQGAWKLVPNDDGITINTFLSGILDVMKREVFRPIALFKFPVSYWNPDMCFHFKDYWGAYSTYKQWFKFFSDTIRLRHKGMNTVCGFFYTIEGEWDPSRPLQDAKPRRRPWIAIFRPMNPHQKWKSTELFIWDVVAWSKYPGNAEIYANDLIFAQRELLQLAHAESWPCFGCPLEQVWLGGSIADHGGESFSQPLDISLNWLAKLPTNIKFLLPAPAGIVPQRGWRKVLAGGPSVSAPESPPVSAREGPPSTVSKGTAASLVDAKAEAAASSGKIFKVFHPPGTDGTHPMSRNRLYDWAEGERRRGARGKTEFVFEPTMKWYNDQVQRGQGLHHLDFSGWRSIFQGHDIPDPEAKSNHGAAAIHKRR